jgi:CheY-specific phosphatase CheX
MVERLQAEALRDGLHEAAAEVMEDAAFVFVEPAEEPIAWKSGALDTRITLSGEVEGWIQLRALPEFGLSLAVNLLGCDDPKEEGIAPGDALAEMLNMVAGVTLEKWFGGGQNVRLSVPATRPSQPAQDAMVAVELMSDDGDPIEMSAAVRWTP